MIAYLKDLIKPKSGHQVWPREVEEVLATHAAVAEVCVAGVMDATKGEVVYAWVVLRGGFDATGTELREFCQSRLAPHISGSSKSPNFRLQPC